ncbi:Lrp/AsnC family transcriptional regulator [Anaerosacchariphilus polymeriproducens]|uniref:Lrp/AsnC family transcriptional regulator n=1 Tax=Anaerosacchariphilus polymeriproducens TaxID=1812858 RepID=A0A371B017_9FIRM|nr:Lrp/AsnC family transcriptional regulator [Anaerosacchariphilus polymeriproducens]RDU25151.1 Lrp/AsnC family transcriptional regulator [Anaerosacchariphilus polymeriproducens]
MLDSTDFKILEILQKYGRMQWKEVGKYVHMSGQAVKNRIQSMENLGIIEGYTVKVNLEKMGNKMEAFVMVFMKSTDHIGFRRFLKANASVLEACRISGEGCYILKVQVESYQHLNQFLDELLIWANYKVNITIERVI